MLYYFFLLLCCTKLQFYFLPFLWWLSATTGSHFKNIKSFYLRRFLSSFFIAFVKLFCMLDASLSFYSCCTTHTHKQRKWSPIFWNFFLLPYKIRMDTTIVRFRSVIASISEISIVVQIEIYFYTLFLVNTFFHWNRPNQSIVRTLSMDR